MSRPVLEQIASFLELDVEAAAAAAVPGAGVAQAAGGRSSSGSSGQRLAHRPFAMDVDSADGRPSSEGEKGGTTIQPETEQERQRLTTATSTRAPLSSTAATAGKGLVRTKNITAAAISEQQQQQRQQQVHTPAGAGNSEPDGRPLGALGARPTSAPGASSDEALFPRPLARAQSLSRLPTAMGNDTTGASRRSMMEGQGLAAGGAEEGGRELEGGQEQGGKYEEEEEEEEDEQGEAELIWTFGQDEDDWSSGGEVVLDSILTDMMVVSAWGC